MCEQFNLEPAHVILALPIFLLGAKLLYEFGTEKKVYFSPTRQYSGMELTQNFIMDKALFNLSDVIANKVMTVSSLSEAKLILEKWLYTRQWLYTLPFGLHLLGSVGTS